MVKKEELQIIVRGKCHDPFRYLGIHSAADGSWEVVTVQPDASGVELHIEGRKTPIEMKKILPEGVFFARIRRKQKPRYYFEITGYHGDRWREEDAYRFGPVLTDFDLYLFNEGNHFRIFEKLGSHITDKDGIAGVHFAVWAPNAKRVSVVGDFNTWNGIRHQMRALGSSGVWEIFIPLLGEGEKYKFEILTQSEDILIKADPYGHYMERRPKTASIVYPIGRYQWKDEEYMQNRRNRNALDTPITIYEVHLGSWKRVPEENNRFFTYREMADDLVPYVKEMGYTFVEFLPVAEHPLDASWGYQVVGYYAPTSRFGTPDDFAYLVDRFHREGIGVIVDWVPAHFPMDDHGLKRFDGTALYEHEDPRKGYHMDWKTLIFNYGRNEVRNFLIANAIYWLEMFHVDGIRVDAVSSMLYLDYSRNPGEWIPNEYGGRENLEAIRFIQKMNQVLHHYYPGVLTIAEESTSWPSVSRPVDMGGLGFSMKWNMGWMNDFLRYMEKDPIYRKYHHDQLTFSRIYAYTENFILVFSHDEVVHGKRSLLSKMPGDDWQKFANNRLALAYMTGHPGKYLTFMGIEFGQWGEWSEERSIDWHLLAFEPHRKLRKFVQDLNHFYRNTPALWEKDFNEEGFLWVNCRNSEHSILSFIRVGNDADEMVLCVVNFTPVTHYKHPLGVPKPGFWEEVFNSDSEIYGGSNQGNLGGVYSAEGNWDGYPHHLEITVPPLAAVFFRYRK
jgi:1,4-alpha-glucan branching enzyme